MKLSRLGWVLLVAACGPLEPTGDGGGFPDAGAGGDAGAGRDAGASVDAGPTVSFRDDVAPALTVCLSCHSQRNTHAEASALVTANAPARSVLYQRITSMGRPMPPSGPLLVSNPAGTALIERWILQGAPNN